MKTQDTPFTAIYSAWLDTFRAMLPGWPAAPKEPTAREAQVAANQEWEHEGGSLKPADAKPTLAAVPKIPF